MLVGYDSETTETVSASVCCNLFHGFSLNRAAIKQQHQQSYVFSLMQVSGTTLWCDVTPFYVPSTNPLDLHCLTIISNKTILNKHLKGINWQNWIIYKMNQIAVNFIFITKEITWNYIVLQNRYLQNSFKIFLFIKI